METTFQDYVRNLVEGLLPGVRVEFLPAREPSHTDPVYPVRFKTETADLVVSFPQRMVLMQDGEELVRQTVMCLVRLIYLFREGSGTSTVPT